MRSAEVVVGSYVHSMMRMRALACGVGLVVVGVAPVAAADHVPESLHMRAQRSAGSGWSPMRWVQRIAQVAPPGGQPAPTPDPTSGTDPASPSGDPPVPGPPVAPVAPARTPGGPS